MNAVSFALLILSASSILADYPCRTIVIFSLDRTSYVSEPEFIQQRDVIVSAVQLWRLGFEAVRVGLPTPNGQTAGGSELLFDDLPPLNSALEQLSVVNDSHNPSNLPLTIENLANTFVYATEPEEDIDYNYVIFTASNNSGEVTQATQKRVELLNQPRARIIVVTVRDGTAPELAALQTGGLFSLQDPDLYLQLTNSVCNGSVEVAPVSVPTVAPTDIFPANADIFLELSSLACPSVDVLTQQITFVTTLITNFTFDQKGIRMSVPAPLGMQLAGTTDLLDSKEHLLEVLNSVLLLGTEDFMCDPEHRVLSAVSALPDLLNIKPHSRALMFLFTDASNNYDIGQAVEFRQKHLDATGLQLATVQLPSGADLTTLATKPELAFKFDDADLVQKLIVAIQSAPLFTKLTSISN